MKEVDPDKLDPQERYAKQIEIAMYKAGKQKQAFMNQMQAFVGSDLHNCLEDLLRVLMENLKDQHMWAETQEERSVCKGGVVSLELLINTIHQSAQESEQVDEQGNISYGTVFPSEEAEPGV